MYARCGPEAGSTENVMTAGEIEEFNRVSQQKTEAAERERHGIQQFVYTLK